MNKVRLILIDDHTLIRETWSFFLNSDARFSVIAQAGTAEEGVELCKKLRPDVVLMDINLPGMNGIQAVPLIRKFAPVTKILGVSLHCQLAYAKAMMQAGASGYITKNSSQEEMKAAIVELSEGRKYICKDIKDSLAKDMIAEEKEVTANRLSFREMEIIDLVKQGFSSKEIASQKSLSVKTVEVHRYNILKKLKLKNAAALVNFAANRDW